MQINDFSLYNIKVEIYRYEEKVDAKSVKEDRKIHHEIIVDSVDYYKMSYRSHKL